MMRTGRNGDGDLTPGHPASSRVQINRFQCENLTHSPSGTEGVPERRVLRRGRSVFSITVLLTLLATLLLAGCGGEETIARKSPKATAEAFIEAMQVGDYEKVAAGRDYETWAAQENPDWETFSPKARDLIVSKLQEDEARKMQALAGMFTGEASVGDVQEQGNTATVIINAGANSLELEMNNIEGKWYVYSVEEQAG